MECHECIDPFNPRGHFVDKHKSRKMPKDYNQTLVPQLQRHFPYLRHNPPIPTHPIIPVFGLCEPKPDHQICKNCNRGFTGSGTNQKNHLRSLPTHALLGRLTQQTGNFTSLQSSDFVTSGRRHYSRYHSRPPRCQIRPVDLLPNTNCFSSKPICDRFNSRKLSRTPPIY